MVVEWNDKIKFDCFSRWQNEIELINYEFHYLILLSFLFCKPIMCNVRCHRTKTEKKQNINNALNAEPHVNSMLNNKTANLIED